MQKLTPGKPKVSMAQPVATMQLGHLKRGIRHNRPVDERCARLHIPLHTPTPTHSNKFAINVRAGQRSVGHVPPKPTATHEQINEFKPIEYQRYSTLHERLHGELYQVKSS
jgi:hypothetical protein